MSDSIITCDEQLSSTTATVLFSSFGSSFSVEADDPIRENIRCHSRVFIILISQRRQNPVFETSGFSNFSMTSNGNFSPFIEAATSTVMRSFEWVSPVTVTWTESIVELQSGQSHISFCFINGCTSTKTHFQTSLKEASLYVL